MTDVMLGTIKAIQYTRDNLQMLLDNFGINEEEVNINYANQSMKCGHSNSKRIKLGEWLVMVNDPECKHGFSYEIVSDEVVRNIIASQE